jgi:hypothetical protein
MTQTASMRPADFTTEEFRRLLRLAGERYAFHTFTDCPRDGEFLIWRHDIDLSPQRALRLARIEQEESARAIYFINPHSEFYNLLDQHCTAAVREIASLGHELGVHFDSCYFGDPHEDFGEVLAREKRMLEDIFRVEMGSFSFHYTTPFSQTFTGESYAGMVNAASDYFRNEVKYCSDSNGIWRYDRLEDVLLKDHERVQVLTHPGLWQDEPMPPADRYRRCVYGRADATWKWINDFLQSCGRNFEQGESSSPDAG